MDINQRFMEIINRFFRMGIFYKPIVFNIDGPGEAFSSLNLKNGISSSYYKDSNPGYFDFTLVKAEVILNLIIELTFPDYSSDPIINVYWDLRVPFHSILEYSDPAIQEKIVWYLDLLEPKAWYMGKLEEATECLSL